MAYDRIYTLGSIDEGQDMLDGPSVPSCADMMQANLTVLDELNVTKK